MIIILIYLSNSSPQASAICSHTALPMNNLTINWPYFHQKIIQKKSEIFEKPYSSFITNYNRGVLQIMAALLQITAKIYYKLREKVIRNYGSSYFQKIQNYYKLRQVLLRITSVFSVITNYNKFYYKLKQVLQITTLLQITS